MIGVKSNIPKTEINREIYSCIERSLNSLGETVKYAILWHVERTCNVSKENFIEKPDRFTAALKKIFGEAAEILEKMIVDEIKKSFGVREDVYDLVTVIDIVKKKGSP